MAEEGSTIDIDGSIMEGGGQILRICTALSCLLGLRVRVMKIRAGRSTPGLRPQHLSGLETVRDLCCGQLENAHIGSTEINFAPGRIKGGALTADTKTAGSVCLLLQVSLPCVLFAESPCELIFKGGTNAEMAPQIDYTTMAFSEHINSVGTDITFTRKETPNSKTHFLDCVACQGKGDLDIEVYRKPTYTDQYPPFDFHHPMEHKRGVIGVLQHQTEMVFKPAAERFGFKLDCDIRKRGYYPRGGGEILVRVSPIKYLKPINLTDRGTITKIYGRAFVAGVLPYKMVKDMISAAVRCIRRELRDLYVNIQGVQEPADKAVGNGSGIIIVAETSTGCIFAGSSLGKKGVTADRVGAEAAEILLRNLRHGGCVDEYLQDQLIIFMALADGVSQIRTGPLTLHTQTAIHFTEQLTKAKFTVTKCDEPNTDSNIIECQGTGLQNKNAS